MKRFKTWLAKKCLNAIYGKNSFVDAHVFYRVWYFNERNMIGYDYKNFKGLVDASNFAYQYLSGTGCKRVWESDIRLEKVKTIWSKKKGDISLRWSDDI